MRYEKRTPQAGISIPLAIPGMFSNGFPFLFPVPQGNQKKKSTAAEVLRTGAPLGPVGLPFLFPFPFPCAP